MSLRDDLSRFSFTVPYFRSKLQDLCAYKFQSSKLSGIKSLYTSGHFLKLLVSLFLSPQSHVFQFNH